MQKGIPFEKLVADIQQKLDPNSTVSHNEKLVDRIGNERQFDVVIRGRFGGLPILGIVECKDHKRRLGPDVVEAFSKKCENLGANLKILVSKHGFTDQAINVAKYEHIACYSLLPSSKTDQISPIGHFYHAVIHNWELRSITAHFLCTNPQPPPFGIKDIKWGSKHVYQYFLKELLTTHSNIFEDGVYSFSYPFKAPRYLSFSGIILPVIKLTILAIHTTSKKRKWISLYGNGYIDWQSEIEVAHGLQQIQLILPQNTQLTGDSFKSDLSDWEDYSGSIPPPMENSYAVIIHRYPQWDSELDHLVPNLSIL